ncbi:adenine nucleotide alpha hydrolase [Maritimibacter sp. 55A14]|uniref:adenine nucleotide alpha hydrolase n=1 Tax=Maritimibacter sp. 55A14 TaxID=2174844 RepID=UPI001E2C8E4C|nr:adenine nucleotide alpha hydrolase [Maritimibacter sp. 55A14]
MSAPRAALSWSSGKDCTLALMEVRRQGLAEVVTLLTTTNSQFDHVAMHGTRDRILRAQARAVGLPLLNVPLPWPCSNEAYEARMAGAVERLKAQGITHVIFGDLFLEDVRAWREARMAECGMQALFPLWGRDTGALSRQMVDDGIRAHLVTLDPARLPADLAGAAYDHAFLDALPEGVDPCGENGEFHTAVLDAPCFAAPIPARRGETESRDGFVYADLVPLG